MQKSICIRFWGREDWRKALFQKEKAQNCRVRHGWKKSSNKTAYDLINVIMFWNCCVQNRDHCFKWPKVRKIGTKFLGILEEKENGGSKIIFNSKAQEPNPSPSNFRFLDQEIVVLSVFLVSHRSSKSSFRIIQVIMILLEYIPVLVVCHVDQECMYNEYLVEYAKALIWAILQSLHYLVLAVIVLIVDLKILLQSESVFSYINYVWSLLERFLALLNLKDHLVSGKYVQSTSLFCWDPTMSPTLISLILAVILVNDLILNGEASLHAFSGLNSIIRFLLPRT